MQLHYSEIHDSPTLLSSVHLHQNMIKIESPAWTQEAHRPARSKYSLYFSVSQGTGVSPSSLIGRVPQDMYPSPIQK